MWREYDTDHSGFIEADELKVNAGQYYPCRLLYVSVIMIIISVAVVVEGEGLQCTLWGNWDACRWRT